MSGGTWDLFKYPGIRSDSDMFTFGFHWRPWPSDTALADGPLILDYLRTVAEEYGVDKLIRYRHRVLSGAWDSETASVDRRDRPRGRAEEDHHQPAVGVLRLLRLRPGSRAGVPGRRGLRRRDHPPAALARGPRLLRQARRRDRQRCHRGDAGAGDGRHRRARDDAAALAVVRPVAGRPRPRGQAPRQAADQGVLPGGTLVQHLAGRRLLRRGPPPAGAGQEAPAHRDRQAAARRLRRRPPLQPDLQPVGPAALLRA